MDLPDGYERDNGVTRPAQGALVPVERVEFGDAAREYLHEYLRESVGYGKHFGRLLLDRDPAHGRLWGWLRVGAKDLFRADFKRGGALSPTRETTLGTEVTAWLDELIGACDEGGLVAVAEDVLRDAGDAWPVPEPTFTCAAGSYAYLHLSSDNAEVLRLFGGAEWRPDTCVISHTSRPFAAAAEVHPEVLQLLVANAVAVVVGAWDDEGYLVWEPA